MDGIKDKEDIISAWKAAWKVSLDGWAIVNEDFSFRSVNPQWLKLLGVLPNEFIGKTFQDITAPKIREIAEQNAKLCKEGIISSYLIHKEYQFSDGTKKKVVLLVVRVPEDGCKPFKFFLSRILLDEDMSVQEINSLESESLSHLTSSTLSIFLNRYWKYLIASGIVLGAALAKLLGVSLL